MQKLQDIKDKMFFETTSILESLSKITSADELLANQHSFSEMSDRIAFLKILAKNEGDFKSIFNSLEVDSFEHQHIVGLNETSDRAEKDFEEVIQEKVPFTKAVNNSESEALDEKSNFNLESNPSFIEQPVGNDAEENSKADIKESELYNETSLLEKERAFAEKEERRREIVEFTANQTTTPEFLDNDTEYVEAPQDQTEKKFKLSNIKGIKAVQHLFDNDPVEDEEALISPDSTSLLKSNVRTEFMEAEKKKPEFKIDLNDKVAFTKSLFAGNEEELKATVAKLNSFSSLEDAKQYLSEVYYQKDWSKVDEYAQRLWNLVESKFM